MLTAGFILHFLSRLYTPQLTKGPAMAMEKVFAPSVVRPPCASRIAWNSSTMMPSTAMTGAPNSTAPRPVPVGWLDEPLTLGILSADSTKA